MTDHQDLIARLRRMEGMGDIQLNELMNRKTPLEAADAIEALQALRDELATRVKELEVANSTLDDVLHEANKEIERLMEALRGIVATNASRHGTTGMMVKRCMAIARAALSVAEAQQAELNMDGSVDRAWARFCGAFGDGPDAPYPGMIAAFETHYGQSFRDKAWRTEAACWASAWHKATEKAAKQAEPVRLTDKECALATSAYAQVRSDFMLGIARAIEAAVLRKQGYKVGG